jgi:tetratricopeptide (TPR) repeat protein
MSLEKELFHLVLEKPAEQRMAFLDRVCGSGPLRERVARLLEMHAAMGTFLGDPARPVAEEPGTVLDRYKLLQRIGEGGFGVVYMADQVEPVRRKVALKIIKLGMDTKQVIARFEAERQALALMDHPGIAKVLDAGTTATGRPYFVMELVKGLPITEYCDQARLDMGARLELFQEVCRAVQHAHQKGVIHRDLKPSNILVTLHDGRPVPKVIDFGIAKATDHRLTERTLFTEFRQMVGTPAYMAPEQAELSGLDVDTRADIYSLGVLLYELLTGTRPFDLATLAEMGYAEILRTIREVDPPRPSTRVSTMGDELRVVALNRATKPSLLGRLMRGDLDWIVMKAMEKDRARRYETASALATDIGRYLGDEPVLATPPAVAYRVRKYLRRHRVGVVATLLVIVGLMGGAVAMLHGLLQARAEARRAEAIQAFLLEMVAAADPNLENGPNYTVRQLLDDFDRRMEGQLAAQPAVEATVRTAMARAFVNLGLYERANAHLDRALAAGAPALGPDHDVLADALRSKGCVLDERNDLHGAERCARDALAMRQRLHGTDHREVAIDMVSLAQVLEDAARLDEAETLVREALAIQRRVLGERHEDIARGLAVLGHIRGQRGDYDGAFRLYEEARATYAAIGGGHRGIGETLTHVCRIHTTRGDFDAAERAAREAVRVSRASLGDANPVTIEALRELGETLWREQRFEEAEATLHEALRLSRAVYGDRHVRTARALGQIGACMNEKGRYEEALGFLREAEPVLRETAPGGVDLAVILNSMGLSYEALADFERAVRCLAEARDLDVTIFGEDHPETATVLGNLGMVKWRLGEIAEAEALLRRALEITRRAKGNESPAASRLMSGYGQVLRQAGRTEEALAITREALEIARARFRGKAEHAAAAGNLATLVGDEEGLELIREALDALRNVDKGDKLLRHSRMNLAFVLHRLNRFEEAAPLFLEVLPDIPLLHGAVPEDHMRYQIGAVITFVAAGRWAEAEAPARDLVDLEVRHRPEGHPQRDVSHLLLGAVLVHLGRFVEAGPILRDIMPRLSETGWTHHWARNLLGGSLAGQGKYDEAERLLTDGYEKMAPPAGAARHRREALERVVRLYEAWGKLEKAAEWRGKLEAE